MFRILQLRQFFLIQAVAISLWVVSGASQRRWAVEASKLIFEVIEAEARGQLPRVERQLSSGWQIQRQAGKKNQMELCKNLVVKKFHGKQTSK